MAGMAQFMGLAASNPIMFIGLILGGLLLFGILFGLAIVVSFVLVAIIQWLLPGILLIIGLFLMMRGRMQIGLFLVVLSAAIWAAVHFGAVAV